MKTKGRIIAIILTVILTLGMLATFTGCAGYDAKYAVNDPQLTGTNANHPNGMKGFSIQGLLTQEQKADGNIMAVAMVFTTGKYNDVKKYFSEGNFADPVLFLAALDQLDVEGRARVLTGAKIDYIDGAYDNPITFYGDAVDLISGKTLFEQAGEYHFYFVVCGEEKVLNISECDKTFTITEQEIETANAFKAAFALIDGLRLMEDEDVSDMTQAEKEQAIVNYYQPVINSLNKGFAISVTKDTDPAYPDDYEITLTKDGQEQSVYITVEFGPEADTELYAIRLVRQDLTYGNMKAFQIGFKANSSVTAETTQAYIIFYSASDLASVTAALQNKTFDDIDAMDIVGKVKIITDLSYADGAGNTFYSDGVDLVSGEYVYGQAGLTIHFYVATISMEETNVVSFVAEASESFTFPQE